MDGGLALTKSGQVSGMKEEIEEGVEGICQGGIVMTDHGSKLGEGTGEGGNDPWMTGSSRAKGLLEQEHQKK